MRTVTNYFLVNLSVSDLLMSLLNCTFNFIFMLNSDWPFGAMYCTVNNFVANVTVAASVFTLVAISVDR
jgi:tachykinin-like receptor